MVRTIVRKDNLIGKYSVGREFDTVKCGRVVVIRWMTKRKREIKFVDSGVVKVVSTIQLLSGSISDKIGLKYGIGTEHETNNGTITVVKHLGGQCRLIKFNDTGFVKETLISSIFVGSVSRVGQWKPYRRKNSIVEMGDIYINNQGKEFVVIEVFAGKMFRVKFTDSSNVMIFSESQILKGNAIEEKTSITIKLIRNICVALRDTDLPQCIIAANNKVSNSTVSGINTGNRYAWVSKAYRCNDGKIRKGRK